MGHVYELMWQGSTRKIVVQLCDMLLGQAKNSFAKF